MRVVRSVKACHAPNAFWPSRSLWQIFVANPTSLLLTRNFANLSTLQNRDNSQQDEIAAANQRQKKDIIPNDLSATLEAHRASNRASLIRQVSALKAAPQKYEHEMRIAAAAQKNASKAMDFVVKPYIEEELARSEDTNTSPVARTTYTNPFLKQEGSRKPQHSSEGASQSNPKNKKSLEYSGQEVLPLTKMIVPEDQLPWVKAPGSPSLLSMERLNSEIAAFYKHMIATPTEKAARQAAIKQVEAIVRKVSPRGTKQTYRVEVFGSERTGLALATSDIDFRFFLEDSVSKTDAKKAPQYMTRRQTVKKLQSLFKSFSKDSSFFLCSIRHARYPLISMLHKESGLDLQVVCSNDTSQSREYIKRYLEEYEGLAEVFTVVKVMLDIRGLTDVFRGGLGSYSVLMMVVASFKLTPNLRPGDIGQHLLAFLDFWSNFDTYKNGITLEPPELFPKATKKFMPKKVEQKRREDPTYTLGMIDTTQPYLLCLQDPADPTNDLGRKGFGIKHIQQTIKAVRSKLQQRIQDNQPGALLSPCVGSSYEMFLARREKLNEYGISILERPEQSVFEEPSHEGRQSLQENQSGDAVKGSSALGEVVSPI